MATPLRARSSPRLKSDAAVTSARFEQQLGKILEHATEVFCQKGYAGASMRDIARATGMSLAGMYHYFGNKERLLYLIQKDTFTTILSRLRAEAGQAADTEQALRGFIFHHLEYFLDHQQAMKVLSHEDDALTGAYGREIADLKRQYYRICHELLNRYKKEKGLQFDSRIASLSLFGMMNWIYTWYDLRLDGGAERLSKEMGEIFFRGITNRRKPFSLSSPRSGRRAHAPEPETFERTETGLSLA
jgi:TetR/AcrR family transcriptional regulator, cholesterol catabolism regulator